MVDPETRRRAAKVWQLYTRPGSDGERLAARARLEEMARRCNLDLNTFTAACGIGFARHPMT